MPKSPLVNFVIENNNVEQSIPSNGISCLLARTKKGPYNDPSALISSLAQFKSIFGGEIVPDGSISNIEKALQLGSKLRIIRVPGNGYFKGVLLNPVRKLDFVMYIMDGDLTDGTEVIDSPFNEDPVMLNGDIVYYEDGGVFGCTDTVGDPRDYNKLYTGNWKHVNGLSSSDYNDYDNRVIFTELRSDFQYMWDENTDFVKYNGRYEGTSIPTYPQTPQPILEISQGDKSVKIGFYTKVGDDLVDGAKTFDVVFYKKANTLYYQITGTGKTVVVESNPVITYKAASTTNNNVVDYIAFNNFLNNSKYLEPYIVSSTLEDKSISSIIDWMASTLDGSSSDITLTVAFNSFDKLEATPVTCTSQVGSSGTLPTADAWIESMDELLNYTDVYQVACSHINQHLESQVDILKVHKAFKDMVEKVQEYTYYIEVPKYKTHYTEGTDIRDKASIIEWINGCINTIGNSMWVSYFAGGIKYYGESGLVVNSDVMGTVLGIGDNSASNHGPWRSFAGMNRGIIEDAHGSVSPNYGSPSRYDDLNDLALNYANMIVVKDTSSFGKRTMLWHCFTSQIKQDSFRYLAIVRLVLFMKKRLRPILDSYLEEPNTFSTWNRIYLEAKPILDNLITQEAITEYSWNGDQHASTYSDLTINNEADVRQGKYKVVLNFKEVMPLQEISMVLSIDKASGSVTTEIDNN